MFNVRKPIHCYTRQHIKDIENYKKIDIETIQYVIRDTPNYSAFVLIVSSIGSIEGIVHDTQLFYLFDFIQPNIKVDYYIKLDIKLCGTSILFIENRRGELQGIELRSCSLTTSATSIVEWHLKYKNAHKFL